MAFRQRDTSSDQWITAREAGRRLGVSGYVVKKVLTSASVRRRSYPGLQDKWSASDVAALIERSVCCGNPSPAVAEVVVHG